MSLSRIKLMLPPDLREYVARRVALDGYITAGEYMRHLIRGDAAEQHDHRVREGLAAREHERSDAPDGDAR